MQPILIAVHLSKELQPLLSRLDRLGHPSQPIVIGNMPCYSIPSLGATAAVNGVPFLEIRCITDGADADAATSFRANCERVLPNIADLLVKWRF